MTYSCSQCGESIEGTARYCPECGAAQTKRCTKCGSTLSPEARFCGECGNKVLGGNSNDTPVLAEIELSPSPLEIELCKIDRLSIDAKGPDTDGDLHVRLQYTLVNNTDFEFARVDSTAQLLTARGLPVKEATDSRDVIIPSGASEDFVITFYAKLDPLGAASHKSHILLSATASKVTQQDLGPLRMPELFGEPAKVNATAVDNRLRVISATLWFTKPDDDGSCDINATALAQNLTQLTFPEARLVIDIDRGSDFENMEVSGLREIRPGAIAMIEASGYAEAAAVRGRPARARLELFETVAYATAQRIGLTIDQTDGTSDEDSA